MPHSRKSPRASRYNYTASGGYFVTICTKDREHYFGSIRGRDGLEARPEDETYMDLNDLSIYTHTEIQRLSERKSVDIHEWIVMPNHIHLLLIIYDFDPNKNVGYIRRDETHIDSRRDAFETRPDIGTPTDQGRATSSSLHVQRDNYGGPRLGQIIGILKSNITKYANQNNIPFARQSRYHDHIIRNEGEYNRIQHYIQTNPANRDKDCFRE